MRITLKSSIHVGFEDYSGSTKDVNMGANTKIAACAIAEYDLLLQELWLGTFDI